MVAVSLVGFPLVTVLVLAGVFGQSPDPEFAGVAPSDHYIVGYVGVVLAALGVITLPVHLATQREQGVVRRFRASGVGAPLIVGREVVLGVVLGTAAAVIVLVAGGAVYGLQAPDDPLGVVGWYLVGLACFIAIGVALGFLLPSGRAATALGNLIFIPMFLLGGGGPPREVMTTADAEDLRRAAPQPRRSAASASPGSAPPTTPTRCGGPSSSPPSPSSSPSAPPDPAPAERSIEAGCTDGGHTAVDTPVPGPVPLLRRFPRWHQQQEVAAWQSTAGQLEVGAAAAVPRPPERPNRRSDVTQVQIER